MNQPRQPRQASQTVRGDAPVPATPGDPPPWWPTAVATVGLTAAGLAVILIRPLVGRGGFDAINYHVPMILRFAEQWPRPELGDYLSATTPGYHLLLAAVAVYVSDGVTTLRVAGLALSLPLVALLARRLTAGLGPLPAMMAGLALAGSLYVFSSAVFALPDNAAWALVLGLLVVALRPRVDVAFLVISAVLFALLVLVRQSHVWAAAAIWAAAWLGPGADQPGRSGPAALFDAWPRRARRLVPAVLATAGGFVVLAVFAWLWGGLTVPLYQGYMQGVNPATPAVIMLQIAAISLFFAGFWARPMLAFVRTRPAIAGGVLAAGLLIAVAPNTTFSIADGRFSGVWNVTRRLPDLFGRTNAAFLAGVPFGALVLASMWRATPLRSAWVLGGSLAAFAAAMTANLNAWPRYHEPLVIMLIALSCAEMRRSASGRFERTARVVGPAALAVALGAVTAGSIASADRQPLLEAQDQAGIARPLRELWPESWRSGDVPARHIRPAAGGG